MYSRPLTIGPPWLQRREIGFPSPLGTGNNIFRQLYSDIEPLTLWDDVSHTNGGIFSLEFSPNGSLLLAACERRNVMIFDPLIPKHVNNIENAHQDCVNCIRFLDDKLFATCSDDTTVALWDIRNLKKKLGSLEGHNNWVKSIEYSASDRCLVSSGFDGNILCWDMDSFSGDTHSHFEAFSVNGLMRTRLTPDSKKMILCTTAGYLMVIHNLEIPCLPADLLHFKPNLYRLMQMSQTPLPSAADFTHLFRGAGKRNRVEFICDFPDGDDAEVVSSMQVHPEGHSVVSRNVSTDGKTEWTCVHNIEELSSSDESDGDEETEKVRWPASSVSSSSIPTLVIRNTNAGMQARDDQFGFDLSISPSDIWEAVVAIHDAHRFHEDRLPILRRLETAANELPASSNDASARTLGTIPRFSRQTNRSQVSQSSSGDSSASENPPMRRRSWLTRATNTPTNLTPEYHAPIASTSTSSNANAPETTVNSTSLSNSRVNMASQPENDPGEGTSSQANRRISTVGHSQRRLNLKRRTKMLKMLRENGRRLRTKYEMNVTARLARQRNMFRRRREIFRTKRISHNRVSSMERVVLMGVFRARGQNGERGTSMQRHNVAALTVTPTEDHSVGPIVVPSSRSKTARERLSKVRVNKAVHQNSPRLTHFMEEPNVGRGFIKELCFSPEGRILCSPFGNGFRLLSFSSDVQDLRHCYPKRPPVPLTELAFAISHSDIVVSTKFSPHHHLLVSGCLSGRICLHQPFRC